jgi:excisionase family DNA binding protein
MISSMKDDRLLSQKEVLEYLGISSETLLKLRKEGLPYLKLRKRVLFRKSDIDAFLESRKIVETPEKRRK